MSPENVNVTSEWGQFVLLDRTMHIHNYRNCRNYNTYNPLLDSIDESEDDNDKNKKYAESILYDNYDDYFREESLCECFVKNSRFSTFTVRIIGYCSITCVALIILPIWYFSK